MAYDPKSLVNGILRLIPRRHHQRFTRVLKACQVRLRGWIFGTGIAMIFLGVGAALGLWILQIPSAFAFGIIASLFEIIPYFGSIIGTFFTSLSSTKYFTNKISICSHTIFSSESDRCSYCATIGNGAAS
ncbi:AI-2E family transporter [Nostoc piscinale]|uniref:AI-2E family transporter n=1 Tax=Nostoc piscinale TaxID=224012 RepID=UPI000A5CF012|nr:AI-2E family transporter [Nostoc piscinale]